MPTIEVSETGAVTFEVVVRDRAETRHQVSVDPSYAERIAPGVEHAELVRRSFAFLLEREPNTSILSSFDLPVIARYFPEYERVMGE